MNMFEQVSRLGHQMSIPGAGLGGMGGLGSDGGWGLWGWGFLYGEIQFIMGNSHMGPTVNRQTLSSLNFIGRW